MSTDTISSLLEHKTMNCVDSNDMGRKTHEL